MAHATSTVTVNRPVAEVFAFLADADNNAKWRAGIQGVEHLSGEGLGAIYQQTMDGPGGRTISGDYRITTYDEPHRLAFAVIAGPVRPTGDFTLEAVTATSTAVTFTLDLEVTGLMRLMAGAIDKQIAVEAASIGNLPTAMAA